MENLSRDIVEIAQQLGSLREDNTVASSVQHCTLQITYWRKYQAIATLRKTVDDASLRLASTQLVEWEKRKESALKAIATDKLDQVIRRLDDMESIGDLLRGIET